MSETEATGVTEDSAPAIANETVSAAIEHKAIGVVDSVGEAMGEAEKWVGDLQHTVKESTDSAMRSARSFRENSNSHFRSIQDFIPHALTQYKTYENAFFSKVTEELTYAKEHPAAAVGIGVAASLVLMRGPRRFFFRQTLVCRLNEKGEQEIA
ncbi:PREDICTED: uncharacterized protein LOC104720153 [Camelina sativa]|uniref:Uncharacterized protein LOC104720153 n=1 Tax=Camelina sativa TaxID=90675 RepID=A0ABM0U630_CAMSA|nr:PREDICTED: uncharacterized protein LOC104720153 [Camelina sativa]